MTNIETNIGITNEIKEYSLVQVVREYNGLVDGVWLQNYFGTIDTATEAAHATQQSNSNRITVAVVHNLNYSCPNYCLRKGLKRLDKSFVVEKAL